MSNSEKNQLCEECGRDRVEFPDETVCAWCLARGEDLTRYREEGMVWTVQPRTLGEFDPVQAERQGMERRRRTSYPHGAWCQMSEDELKKLDAIIHIWCPEEAVGGGGWLRVQIVAFINGILSAREDK